MAERDGGQQRRLSMSRLRRGGSGGSREEAQACHCGSCVVKRKRVTCAYSRPGPDSLRAGLGAAGRGVHRSLAFLWAFMNVVMTRLREDRRPSFFCFFLSVLHNFI